MSNDKIKTKFKNKKIEIKRITTSLKLKKEDKLKFELNDKIEKNIKFTNESKIKNVNQEKNDQIFLKKLRLWT